MKVKKGLSTQIKGSRGKVLRIITYVVILAIMIVIGKIVGRNMGQQAAVNKIQQQLLSEQAPAGFMGANWLITKSQAEALFPDARWMNPEVLRYEKKVFGRPAAVGLIFKDNALVMAVVTFKDNNDVETYKRTQNFLEEKYGSFSKSLRTKDALQSSKKTIGRVAIHHQLYRASGFTIEQVMLFLKKG